jgi:hypothetical protein
MLQMRLRKRCQTSVASWTARSGRWTRKTAPNWWTTCGIMRTRATETRRGRSRRWLQALTTVISILSTCLNLGRASASWPTCTASTQATRARPTWRRQAPRAGAEHLTTPISIDCTLCDGAQCRSATPPALLCPPFPVDARGCRRVPSANCRRQPFAVR